MSQLYKPTIKKPNGKVWVSPTWYVRFTNSDGKQVKINTKANSKKEAQAIANILISKENSIKLGITTKETVDTTLEIESVLDMYLSDVKMNSSPSTHYERESVLKRMLLGKESYISGLSKLTDITADKVSSWMSDFFNSEILDRKVNAPKKLDTEQRTSYIATHENRIKGNINKYISYLKIFLNWCVAREKLVKNPLKTIKKLPWVQTSRAFTVEEEEKLINASSGTEKAILVFLADTGLRLNEMANLKWDHVNFDTGSVLVESNAVRKTKSKKSRIVYLTSRAKKELESLPRVAQYVFASSFGKRRYDRLLPLYIKRLAKQIGIRDWWNVNVHSLRKSYATAAITATKDVAAVQYSLGHSQPTLVLKIYHQLNDGHLKNLASALDKVKS